MKEQLSILINAPVEKVFQYITRHEVRKYWQNDLLSTLLDQHEKFKTSSSITSFIDIVRVNGAIKAYEVKVAQSVNNLLYDYILLKPQYKLYISFTFSQQPGTAHVILILSIQVEPKGLYRLFTFHYLRKEYRKWHSSLLILKKLLEN